MHALAHTLRPLTGWNVQFCGNLTCERNPPSLVPTDLLLCMWCDALHVHFGNTPVGVIPQVPRDWTEVGLVVLKVPRALFGVPGCIYLHPGRQPDFAAPVCLWATDRINISRCITLIWNESQHVQCLQRRSTVMVTLRAALEAVKRAQTLS